MKSRVVLILSFLFLWSVFYAQKLDYQFNLSYGEVKNDNFKGEVFYDLLEGDQNFILRKLEGNFDNFRVQITNYKSSPVESKYLSLFHIENLNEDILVEPIIMSERFQSYNAVKIYPFFKNSNSGAIEKVDQIEIEIISIKKPSPEVNLKSFTSNSVLSSGNGDWYRIGVVQDGLHKIDANFLQTIGVELSGLGSNQINIYGNGQGMLSESNSDPRIDDLSARPIQVFDGGDGSFEGNDYFVFYAKGPNTMDYNNGIWTHERNNYTDTSYYFVNIGDGNSPNRISIINQSTDVATIVQNTFLDYQFVEDDKFNLNKSGTEWLGDVFDAQLNVSYPFNFPNIVSTDSIVVNSNIGISTPITGTIATKFTINAGNVNFDLKPTSGSGQSNTSPKARLAQGNFKSQVNTSNFNVNFSFDKAGYPSAIGYLDWVGVNALRDLKMDGSQMEFTNAGVFAAGAVIQFEISNAGNIEYIWDVSNQQSPSLINFQDGSTASFILNSDTLRKFVAATNTQYFTPVFFGGVANQNLHGLPHADMIIVTSSEFNSAAARLAAHHLTEGITAHIVTQQEIFNEFSSGMRDPVAIRHFLKMFYDRATGDPNLIPKYCLILGDCTYDFRNILNSNSDFVMSYQSKESLASSTYATDDFFVILDDNAIMRGTDLMDMAIGRIPVRTSDEAEGMVDKIIRYSTLGSGEESVTHCTGGSSSTLGDWRNVVTMISDDEDSDAYFIDVENMEGVLDGTHPELNILKIHSDAYQEVVTPGGERYEEATSTIKSRVQRGALIANYIGHGGETGWADEQLLNVETINGWTNAYKMPVFMTATCEFSRYDDHDRTSAGEFVVLNKSGGGIGLFTTTRLVYTTTNRQIARVFYDTVVDKVNGTPQVLGDIYKGAKNKFSLNHGSTEARKFTFLGDPAVKIAVPLENIVLDSINGIDIQVFNDTINALSLVSVSGHIEDQDGNLLSGFNGYCYPSIYDKISQLSTLGNSIGSSVNDFEMWKNLVYKGKATVTNGYFNFEFIVPQDISYTYGPARFSLYAENGLVDGNGFTEDAIIGGINANAIADGNGPEISLFMNNESFVDGGLTDETPVFIAKVFDENGINMVGNGIGHNIEIRLDNSSETIVLNDFYESDIDTYKSGSLSYQLDKLDPGEHTIEFKVWDVYNNSSSQQIIFVVEEEENIAIEHLLNYPNPFTTNTEFSFELNQLCEYVDVQIEIFTVAGNLVKTIDQRIYTDGYRIHGIRWNGRDDFGDRIGIGTYVYRLTVSDESGESKEKYEKMVIMN